MGTFTVLVAFMSLAARKTRPTHMENTFADGDQLELRVFISSTPRFTAFNDSSALVCKQHFMLSILPTDRRLSTVRFRCLVG